MNILFFITIVFAFSQPVGWEKVEKVVPKKQPAPVEPSVINIQAKEKILGIAKRNTACLNARIPNRGPIAQAPGAFYGLSIVMARSICRAFNDAAKKAMLHGREGKNRAGRSFDVFNWYSLDHSDEKTTMLNLYGLLLAHVFQETSGKFWEGVDVTNSSSNTSNTAEAGLCQTSNNIHQTGSRLGREGMKFIVNQYSRNQNECLKDEFSIGMNVGWGRNIIGSGEGAEFQKLMRSCPAAALEHCAIAVRHVMPHYGPLIRKNSRIVDVCQSTFEEIYQFVKSNKKSVCHELSIKEEAQMVEQENEVSEI